MDEIRAVLDEGDEDRIKRVRSYERSHKNRAGVIDASERELAKRSPEPPSARETPVVVAKPTLRITKVKRNKYPGGTNG